MTDFVIAILLVVFTLFFVRAILRFLSTQRAFNEGTSKSQAHEYDQALEIWNQMINEQTRSPVIYLNRGVAYAGKGEIDRAIADYDKVIELHPKQIPIRALAFNNRGYAYSRKGEFEKALLDCDKAVSLNPKHPFGYGSRGHVYYLMEKYDKALADFQQSALLQPDHKFAIAGQALTHKALGNDNEAKRLWRLLIKMDEKYHDPQTIQNDYHCADKMVNSARDLISSL